MTLLKNSLTLAGGRAAVGRAGRLPGTRKVAILAAAVAFAVFAAFAPVLRNDFVNYDDPDLLTGNPNVLGGLTPEAIRWAFTSREHSNWLPLTWLSHQIDFQLFGTNAGAHHLVSVLIHGASAALLVRLLFALTGSLARSGLVAALFALHPLRVESVAWASERKDVLFVFFALLALTAWLRYARGTSLGAYAAALGLFACALMSKSTVVTLPALLLLLDFWPLNRWRAGQRLPALRPGRLVLEKAPFVVLAAAVAAVTIAAQRGVGAVPYTVTREVAIHLLNACRSCGAYVAKTLWPAKLAVYYPYVWRDVPWWQPALGAILVAAVTAVALAGLKRRPALLAGWAWYLVALLPVLGIVQAGGQSMADRYTYLPHIGLFIAIVWTLGEILAAVPRLRAAAAAAALLLLGALAAATSVQATRWRTSETLFRHAVAVTERNSFALTNLGSALAAQGRTEEARLLFAEASRVNPLHRAAILRRTADFYAGQGRVREALQYYLQALEVTPDNEHLKRRVRELGGPASSLAPTPSGSVRP